MVNQGEGLDPRFMETRDCVTSYALSKVVKLYAMSEQGAQEWLKSEEPIKKHIEQYQGQMSKSLLQSLQCDQPLPQRAQLKSKVKVRRCSRKVLTETRSRTTGLSFNVPVLYQLSYLDLYSSAI